MYYNQAKWYTFKSIIYQEMRLISRRYKSLKSRHVDMKRVTWNTWHETGDMKQVTWNRWHKWAPVKFTLDMLSDELECHKVLCALRYHDVSQWHRRCYVRIKRLKSSGIKHLMLLCLRTEIAMKTRLLPKIYELGRTDSRTFVRHGHLYDNWN